MSTPGRLRPSDAARWARCAGAVNLSERLKARRSNVHAAEGTFAHSVRETCLSLGLDPYHLIGMRGQVDGHSFECDEYMAEHLQPGIDRVRQFDGEMTVEYNVKLDRWMPGQSGTLDAGVCGRDLIVISDLKYGMGVPVNPIENYQQIIYALGFWDQVARHQTSAKEFLIIIDQPRISSAGGEWSVSLAELLQWGEFIERAAEATKDPKAPRTPSIAACQWCDAAKVENACPEFHDFCMEVADYPFARLDQDAELGLPPLLTNPLRITPERRSFIVQHAHVFTKWLERLHADAINDAVAGRPVPGLKAVAGRRGPMKFRDKKVAEDTISSEFGDRGFKKVMLTPTQIQKTVATEEEWSRISPLVERGQPKPVLVPVEDNRPAIVSHDDMFDDEPEEAE